MSVIGGNTDSTLEIQSLILTAQNLGVDETLIDFDKLKDETIGKIQAVMAELESEFENL